MDGTRVKVWYSEFSPFYYKKKKKKIWVTFIFCVSFC